MFVDRVLYPVTTLGPGARAVLWTSGCSKRCPGCANPELWERRAEQDLPISQVVGLLARLHDEQGARALTVTGGDPLEQPEDLAELLEAARPLFDDVLVYTGYTLDEARAVVPADFMAGIEENADALIDGRYIDELNDGKAPLRGSTNQVVHYLNPVVRDAYERYMGKGRSVQNVVCGERIISVGIHNREGGLCHE